MVTFFLKNLVLRIPITGPDKFVKIDIEVKMVN